MTNKTLLLRITFLLWGIPGILAAQSLVIKVTDGTETTYQTSTLRNFTFSGSSLLLLNKSGVSNPYGLSTSTKIYFSSEGGGNETGTDLNSSTSSIIQAIPNPVSSTFYLTQLPDENTRVYIFCPDGKLVFQTMVSSGNSYVDISHLPTGMYLLKIKTTILRIVKL